MWQPRVQRGHLFGEKTQYELFRFSKLHLGALALAVAGAGADLARGAAAAVYRKILKLGSKPDRSSSGSAAVPLGGAARIKLAAAGKLETFLGLGKWTQTIADRKKEDRNTN